MPNDKDGLGGHEIEVSQKAAIGSTTTQIAVQYVGMTPEQAAKQTINLFMENSNGVFRTRRTICYP